MTDNTRDITLRQLQNEVDRWITGPGVKYFSPLTNMAILTEEVGEVARIMARTHGEQSWRKGAPRPELADELADVVWVLAAIANQNGIDLTEAFVNNLRKKTIRDLERHRNNPKLDDANTDEQP